MDQGKPEKPGKQEQWKRAMHVSKVTMLGNAVLSLLKLFAGICGHSQAMISDAAHSASDVFSTLVVMAGVKLSSKNPDEGHPYGHERLECEASILLSCMLFATGAGIGIRGIGEILSGPASSNTVPGLLPLMAAVLSIVVKEWMFCYTKRAAADTGFQSLMADAWHHRSDALSSIGALLGIAGARMGFAVLDPLAGIAISILIGKAAVEIFIKAMDQLVDKSCEPRIVGQMEETAARIEGVKQVEEIRTRRFGSRVYVDIAIAADGSLTLCEAGKIAEKVHDTMENSFPEIKHCTVCLRPSCAEDLP